MLCTCSIIQYHKTALHHAVERGHREIVQLLMEKGADPNVQLQDLVGVLLKSSFYLQYIPQYVMMHCV